MNSRVIWITGLSGAGKSTLSNEVVSKLRDLNMPVILLDGDELREIFGAVATNTKNHGREGRIDLAMKYSYLSKLLSDQGFIVVIATISLFHEVHDWNRRNLAGYVEIFLKVPISVLQQRDPKGIYKKYSAGEIQNVAGLDLNIDEPNSSDIVFDYDKNIKPVDMATEIINYIFQKKGNHGGEDVT